MQRAFYLPGLSTIRQYCRNRVTTTTRVSTGSHHNQFCAGSLVAVEMHLGEVGAGDPSAGMD
jgi:hypothetical protein